MSRALDHFTERSLTNHALKESLLVRRTSARTAMNCNINVAHSFSSRFSSRSVASRNPLVVSADHGDGPFRGFLHFLKDCVRWRAD